MFDRLGVGAGTRHLDVACGSGFAANIAHRRGATVSGLDASEDLIDIARARTPDGDFRVGDMFALPYDDGAFDIVTSFNGIWNGCDDALDQARTVLTDDGLLGLTYWGAFERMGLMPYFLTVIEHSPPSHQAANVELGETSNVIEDMLRATDFDLLEQGTVEVINEWPDVDTAVRALAAAGPSVPAIEAIGYDNFCECATRRHHPDARPEGARRRTHLIGVGMGDRTTTLIGSKAHGLCAASSADAIGSSSSMTRSRPSGASRSMTSASVSPSTRRIAR